MEYQIFRMSSTPAQASLTTFWRRFWMKHHRQISHHRKLVKQIAQRSHMGTCSYYQINGNYEENENGDSLYQGNTSKWWEHNRDCKNETRLGRRINAMSSQSQAVISPFVVWLNVRTNNAENIEPTASSRMNQFMQTNLLVLYSFSVCIILFTLTKLIYAS